MLSLPFRVIPSSAGPLIHQALEYEQQSKAAAPPQHAHLCCAALLSSSNHVWAWEQENVSNPNAKQASVEMGPESVAVLWRGGRPGAGGGRGGVNVA